MPEGHTIHRAARIQRGLFAGRVVRADSPQGRFTEGAALISGRVLEAIEAYGKHLLYRFEDGVWLHVHLGLFGKFRAATGVPPEVRGAIRLRLIADDAWMTLSGPTACALIDETERRLLLGRIGPDPIRTDSRPARVVERITASGAPIGVLLMDQSVIGGIGNVYRAEIAFRAKIAPTVRGRDLTREQVLALWQDARELLRAGEKTGRIVTTRPEDRPHPRGAVRRGEQYYVYHRTGRPCLICTTPIRQAPMAARTVYFCPTCQRAPIPSSATIAGIRERRLKKPRVAAGQAAAS